MLTPAQELAVYSILCLVKENQWPTIDDYNGFNPEVAYVVKAEDLINKVDLNEVQVNTRVPRISIETPDIRIQIPMRMDTRIREQGQFDGTLFIFPIEKTYGYAPSVLVSLFARYDIEYTLVTKEMCQSE